MSKNVTNHFLSFPFDICDEDEGKKRNKEGKWKPLISCFRPFFTSRLSNAYPCEAAGNCRIQRLASTAADEEEREEREKKKREK